MEQKIQGYRKYLYFSSIITALGVIFSTTLRDTSGLFGLVLIATGGLLFFIAIRNKRKEGKNGN